MAENGLVARAKGMLELTGHGDDGTTGLLGGGRSPKDDLRIEAYGTVDEASSAIGLAKSLTTDTELKSLMETLQRGLYRLGAELATNPEQEGRFARMEAADVDALELETGRLESLVEMPTHFVLPGATPASGAIDVARAVVRRAERRCVSLAREGQLGNAEVLRYLNRLSLLLFVAGRYDEHMAGVETRAARDAG